MAQVPEVNKDKNIVEQLEDIVPYSANIIFQEQLGMPVNVDRVKNARFVLSQLKAHRTLQKEEKRIEMQERRFNFGLLDTFGSEEQKTKIKDLFQKSFDKLKFIENTNNSK
jgi:hypothetical protein